MGESDWVPCLCFLPGTEESAESSLCTSVLGLSSEVFSLYSELSWFLRQNCSWQKKCTHSLLSPPLSWDMSELWGVSNSTYLCPFYSKDSRFTSLVLLFFPSWTGVSSDMLSHHLLTPFFQDQNELQAGFHSPCLCIFPSSPVHPSLPIFKYFNAMSGSFSCFCMLSMEPCVKL